MMHDMICFVVLFLQNIFDRLRKEMLTYLLPFAFFIYLFVCLFVCCFGSSKYVVFPQKDNSDCLRSRRKQSHSEWFAVTCAVLEKLTKSELFTVVVIGTGCLNGLIPVKQGRGTSVLDQSCQVPAQFGDFPAQLMS